MSELRSSDLLRALAVPIVSARPRIVLDNAAQAAWLGLPWPLPPLAEQAGWAVEYVAFDPPPRR